MIEGLKPYAEYKDSGLPWASRIPTHWSLVPNRAVLKRRKVLVGEQHRDYKLLSLTKKGLVVRDISTGKGKFSSDLGTSQEVRKGDLVFCLFDIPETPRTVGLSAHDGMITSAYTVFESTKLTKNGVRYLEKFYLALDDQKLMSPLYSGLRNTIAPPRFLGTKTPLPPPDEQAAIVRFLDHANRKIDRFIRVKRKLIGLLNEQKQAIIHRAVARGLDPNVALKPSGGLWFKEVPKLWDVVTMGRVIRAAIDGPHFSPQYQNKGIPFLSARNVRADKWLLDNAKFISESNYKLFCKRVIPEVGDVLYTKGGTTGVARAVDLEFPFQVWVHIAVLKLDRQMITPEFLALCLNSPRCYEQAQLFTRGATNQDLGLGRMKQIEMPLPPTLAEQVEIVSWVKAQLETFTTAITRTEREIALMQEYRTRLTSDIVTGKLDVREAAAKLPELSEEAGIELLDEAEILDDTDAEET